jgi:hypothetical protein
MDAASESTEFVILRMPQHDDYSSLFESILSVLSSHPGDCDITLEAEVEGGTLVRVKANPALRIRRSGELEEKLKSLGCKVGVERITNQIRA